MKFPARVLRRWSIACISWLVLWKNYSAGEKRHTLCRFIGDCASWRIKLGRELSKRSTGKTVYFLDEPTTGLHYEDIRMLLTVINELVDQGNTVIVIEHNLHVIKVADHIIDLGPEGGEGGGRVVAQGAPDEVAKIAASYTGKYLQPLLAAGSESFRRAVG